jgi:hypothetical protein
VAASALAKLFASRFIARPDIKAVQHSDGSYAPTRGAGWKAADIDAHIAGAATYGHYLLNTDDTVKLFCFDVDLRQDGHLPSTGLGEGEAVADFTPADPRAVWADRKDVRRNYLKYSMRMVAHVLAERIQSELGIDVAAAYSGSKGVHVYGMTGKISAADARDGAMIVIDSLAMFEPERGDSLFRCKDTDVENPFTNFSIEVYPKQSSLAGKDLGNLLRLPLGRNNKSKDPTFFMDMTAPLAEMRPVDPEWALTTDSPWKRPGE